MTYLNPEHSPVDAEKSLYLAAAKALCDLMGDMSEDCWCAGWLDTCEFDLWSMVLGGPRGWGMGEVSESDVAQLKELSKLCGGWIVWREKQCETWIPLAEWLPLYERGRR